LYPVFYGLLSIRLRYRMLATQQAVEKPRTKCKTTTVFHYISFPRRRESTGINDFLDASFRGHDESGGFRVSQNAFSTAV
jgi:hypothetical protein